MNIVAIAGSTIPSDTANSIQVMKACNALVQIGHDVTLLVPENRNSTIGNRKSETLAPHAHRPGSSVPGSAGVVNLKSHYGLQADFPIEWLSSSSRRMFTWNSVRRARALKADLIYTWFPQSAVFGLLQHMPVIFEIHIQPTGTFGPIWHRAFASLRGRKRLVSITRALVELLENDFHIHLPAEQIIIAPNGVDLERFVSLPDPVTARGQLGLREAPTVMCTGHLYAGRGVELFIALARTIPDAHFVWVGGRSEDIEFWRQRVEANKIYNVTFVGFIPNGSLPVYQAAADILLMPYSQSIMGSSGTADSAPVASPMKMFEYMATGRAIASSYLPVIREVLNDTNAVFCKPDDINSWKYGLERLLQDEHLRYSLGQQAKQDAQGYTWLARAQRILNEFP